MIKIKVDNKGFSGYNGKFQFAFCTAPIKGVRYQITQLHSCRDYLHDSIKAQTHKEIANYTGHDYSYGKNRLIDMNKLRLIVTGSMRGDDKVVEAFKAGLYSGKRVINFYEKSIGLQNTRIFEVKYTGKKKCWLLIGPKEWMHNPYLLSLFTLILRVFTTTGKNVKLKTEEDIIKFYTTTAVNHISSNDKRLLNYTWNKGLLIMQNRDYLFKDLTTEVLFPEDRVWSTFHSQGGIYSLCKGTSYNVVISRRILKLYKDKNIAETLSDN